MNIFKKLKLIVFRKKRKKKKLLKTFKNKAGEQTKKLPKQNIYTLISNSDNINSDFSIEKITTSIPEEQTLYKLSKFFSNFSDNTRLKIISCLSFGELCVSDIAKALNMNQTTISHQLAYLKTTGTVVTRRDGKTIYYSLATTEIQDCLTCGANFIAM